MKIKSQDAIYLPAPPKKIITEKRSQREYRCKNRNEKQKVRKQVQAD